MSLFGKRPMDNPLEVDIFADYDEDRAKFRYTYTDTPGELPSMLDTKTIYVSHTNINRLGGYDVPGPTVDIGKLTQYTNGSLLGLPELLEIDNLEGLRAYKKTLNISTVVAKIALDMLDKDQTYTRRMIESHVIRRLARATKSAHE